MLKLFIETGNAAFDDDDRDLEIARILRCYALGLEQGNFDPAYFELRDINGNKVGEAQISERDA